MNDENQTNPVPTEQPETTSNSFTTEDEERRSVTQAPGPQPEPTNPSSQEPVTTPSVHTSTTPSAPQVYTDTSDTENQVAPVHNSPGILVLQWLTYAFWGWFIVALSFLTAQSVGYFVDDSPEAGYGMDMFIAYSLAAVIVLFVISLICDLLYSRSEPAKKHGAAMVIMIIHAVLFALCGIGAVITAVFSVVKLMIGDSGDSYYSAGNEGTYTTLITSIIIAVVYGVTLLRTLRPFKLKRASILFGLFMAVITIVVTAMGIAGPALQTSRTRDDRLIESNLGQVSSAIRAYTLKNDKLPVSLEDIADDLKGDAKTLIQRELVEYRPGSQVSDAKSLNISSSRSAPLVPANQTSFNYELCVTYKAEKGSQYDSTGDYETRADTSPDTYRHEAGRVCYDLVTRYSY